jgi:hypothetical protein
VSFFVDLGSQLTAERDTRPQFFEEAAAVGPQVLGYEFAWKLRLWRSVQNSLPTSVWKLWISSIVEPQAHTWALKRRVLPTL